MIGQAISHYLVTAKLGEGGMGEVYLATDTSLDRQVALKFLPSSLQSDPEARERLIREAKAASRLCHQSIRSIYSIDEAAGRDFIVMEYVEGEALSTLQAREDLSLEEILDLVIQIADGLQTAHEQGVVHRDIKPDNILVAHRRQVKIMDFGLAFRKGIPTLTRAGAVMGTAYYMSPEQAEGKRVDHRTDLFSLGVILYELVCRHRPFEGTNETAILYALLSETPHPMARYSSRVTDELQRIVTKCLAKSPEERYQSAAELVADLRHLGGRRALTASAVPIRRRTMIAVLPFENLGRADDEYFADGMTEEITSRLASVGALGVISRTSAIQYKGSRKSIREIGAELGVEFVLEGTVRWSRSPKGESRVRITPQLIHVAEDVHVWSDRYDRVIDDIFAVQSDIAEQVVGHLNITLAEPERVTLEERPTENLEAYQWYLQGREHLRNPDRPRDECLLAAQMFQRAVELDPTFALAYADLATIHAGIYQWGYDASPGRLAKSKEAVDRALALQPNLPWAHKALCYYYYWGLQDYDSALRALAVAEAGLPNDPDVLATKGFILRRRGKFRFAIDLFERAFLLNPRDAELPYDIAYTYSVLQEYSSAEKFYDQSISLAPDQCRAYIMKAQAYDLWRGDTRSARATLASCPRQDNNGIQRMSSWQFVLERDYAAAFALLARIHPMNGIGAMVMGEAADVVSTLYLLAVVHSLMHEPDRAHACHESARDILEKELKERPDDHRVHSSLGLVYAGLGLKDDAIREGKRGAELIPVSKDALIGPEKVECLAQIYITVDERDAALDQIEYLLSMPSGMTVPWLRLDPRFDQLRDHPRFRRLLQQPV